MKKKRKQSSKIPQSRRRRRRVSARHNRKHIFSYVLFWILVIGYSVVCGWAFLIWEGTRISHIVVTGTQRMSADQIEQQIETSLDDTVWKYFSRAQYLFLRPQAVERYVQEMNGIIRSAHVHTIFPDTVIIDIDEWTHVYLWCVQESDKCFLFEKDGRIGRNVAQDDAILRDNPVIRINDFSAQDAHTDTYISLITPTFIAETIEKFAQGGVSISENKMSVPHRRGQELVVKTQEGWTVQISAQRPLDVTVRAVASLLAHGMTPQEREHLMTVDVRLGRKIFYQIDDVAIMNEEEDYLSKETSLDE